MVAMIACYAMIFIDESGIAVILPQIQATLNLSNNAIHWIVNSYLLVLSILLLVGGKLSDIYGQRHIFSVGIVIFLIASVICGFSQNTEMIIGGRLLQGIGASLLMPCILIVISRGFPGSEFGKAFGVILGVSNLFYAIGPFIAGALAQYLSWRWFFWINIPVGIVCIAFTFLVVAKDTNEHTRSFSDIKGAVTLIIGLGAFISALMQGAEWGWNSFNIIGLFIIAIIALILFVNFELQVRDPLLEIRLLRNKKFLIANIILFCTTICLAIIVFLALLMQTSLEFSPMMVGFALFPATLTLIFIPSLSGLWVDRAGPRGPILLGTFLILVGMIWIAATADMEKYSWLVLGLLIFGIGIPLAIPASCTMLMSSVNPSQSGMASGMLSTVRQLALSMGVAILSAIISSYNNTHFSRVLKISSDYMGVKVYQLNLLLAGKNTIEDLSADRLAALKQVLASIYTHAFIAGVIFMILFATIAFAFACALRWTKS